MSTIDPRLQRRALQLAYSTIPQYANITIDINSDGNIVYTDKVTGRTSIGDPSPVINYRETLGLVDYRAFDPGTGRGPFASIASNAGALQLDSEVMVINQYLRDAAADPSKASKLRSVGLDHMIGKEVTGEFFKFDTAGRGDKVKAIQRFAAGRQNASLSATDEGLSFLVLNGKTLSITGTQASYLRIVSGAEQVQPKFLAELTQDWSKIGKLAKRLQSTMSPRNVAVGEEFIASILDRTQTVNLPTGFAGLTMPFTRSIPFQDRALVLDGVGTKFELMFRDPASDYRMTKAEREFAMAGVGGDPVTLSKADRRLRGPEKAQKIKELWDQRLTGRREEELKTLKTVYNFEDWEIDRMKNMFDEANAELADSSHELHKTDMTHVQKQFKLMKQKVKDLKDSTRKGYLGINDRKFSLSMQSAFDGMEKARDGQYYITESLVKDMRKGFQDELTRVRAEIKLGGAANTLEQTQTLTQLQKQIDHLGNALEKIRKNEDVIARVNIGIGQFKGEAMVLSDTRAGRFKDPITGLVPYVIGDTSAIKSEVGSNFARNILMDVGDSSTEVFSDPLMALYHGDYFTQPAMINSMRQNASYGLGKTQEFMQSAEAPSAVLEALKKDIELAKDVMLDPQTRMSHLRKAREAEEIMTQMASGIRANEIPAMVRRVSDHYSSQVVRLKNGRADVVMPTASRFSLRTFESRQVLAEGFDKYKEASVDLAYYGISSTGADSLKTVGFRVKGHTLMMSGDAAYLYQHSLGGFDLDDKGIPLMSTFQGAGGKKRLAFLTLRQPTSFQESLAMSADLSDSDTVHALFENNDQFKLALEDDTILSALGIDKNKDKNYIQLKQMINGGGGKIERSDVDQEGIEDLIIRISESDHVYPGGLPQLTNSQVVQMVMAHSPSVLGLDKFVRDGRYGSLSPWGQYIRGLGMNPSDVPVGYDSDAIFQVLKKPLDTSYLARALPEVSSVLGYTVTDREHLQDILRGTGAGFRAGDDIKATEKMLRITQDIMLASVNSDAAESIGLFVNRQGAAVSVLETSKKILLGETALGVGASSDAYDKFIGMASIMTLPASEAVDVAKQVGVEQVLYNFGEAVEMAQQAGVSPDSIEQALGAYVATLKSPTFSPLRGGLNPTELNALNIPSQLSSFGQGSLRAFSSVGYVRGKQIAEQITRTTSIDVNELYGLQEVMFEGGFSRITGQDRVTVKQEVLRGLEAAMNEEVSPGVSVLNPAQRSAIQEHYNQIATQDTQASLQSMTMQVGTAGYNRYAELDQMVRAIMDIQSGAISVNRQAMVTARNNARNLDPVAKAEYQDATENIIGTVSTDLKSLQQKVQSIMSGDMQGAVNVKTLRTTILSDLHKGLSAAMQGASIDVVTPTSGDANKALDIMETLSANLQSTVGYETRNLLQGTPTILEDGSITSIDTVDQMTQAMRRRIIARSSQTKADKLAVMRAEDAYASIGQLRARAGQILADKEYAPFGVLPGLMPAKTLSTNLADMTTDEAEAIIEAGRKLRKSRKADLTPAEQIIGDFAGRVKALAGGKALGDRPGEAPEAANAFMYHIAGRKELEKAGEQAAEAMKGFLSGSDIPVATRDAVARSRSTDRTAFSAGTAYKRMTESFKTGALGDALKNKGVRTGLAAAAALSVFGFVKSYRRDHSADDASGPPLLPGGSAYESGYPARQAVIDNLRTINPLTRGMQYKVYASGSSEDAEKLRSMVGGVTDGQVNSTMYSSLPLLGQDPYSQVASQF
jgi:hypothetical protein